MPEQEPTDADQLGDISASADKLEHVQLDEPAAAQAPEQDDPDEGGDIALSFEPAPTEHALHASSAPNAAENDMPTPTYSAVLTPPAVQEVPYSPFHPGAQPSSRPSTPESTRAASAGGPSSPGAANLPSSSPRTLLSPRQAYSPPPASTANHAPLHSAASTPSDRPFRSPPPGPAHTRTGSSHVPLASPTSTHADLDAAAPPADLSDTRFESIPLQTTPPHSATVPLPSSPHLGLLEDDKGKRRSWNGFGLAKHRETAAHGSTPHLASPDLEEAGRRSTSAGVPNGEAIHVPAQAEDEAGPSTPPRRQAPPAHPHPFPIPSPSSVHPPAPSTAVVASSAAASQPGGRAKPSTGLSTFEKVVSHTRPPHLPPKPREEDDTHYHQWEEMMTQAREHEAAARKEREARRAEKEKRLWINTPRWEELLKDPQGVEMVKSDPSLRRLWFEGSPSHLRGQIWSRAIGNPLAMRKDAYKSYLVRAKKATAENRFPSDILQRIDDELDGTFPPLGLFQRGRPMRDDLREFLLAWVVYRSDEGLGYAPYISTLGAMFLLVSPPSTAFTSLCNLLARPCLRAFYTETSDEIDAFYRVFENLEADTFPKIYANCKNLGLKVPQGWFRSVLTEQVPFEAVCRLWDQIMLEGDSYIFRSCLAIVNFLEPRLHFPDKEEILSVLEGRNRATLAITERERERARLKGEAVQEDLDGKMSVFGLTEEALFEYLDGDQWKESRFERLVLREMPD